MRMFVRLVLGLFVLKAAVASPRFSRQANLDIYDDANYDEELNNVESEDTYDYEDGLTIDEPEVGQCVVLQKKENVFTKLYASI